MTDLVMAIHFHQPVGNFDYVIENACDKCYIPFLETLRGYPDIKMTFHFTGCLLEWAEHKRPEIIDMVREMASTGQIELMAGGFYEPILPSIPRRDRLAQIHMLKDYIREKFLYEASGAWVAERVWEPELPSVMYDAGIKYVILDDTHFLYAGIPKDSTFGYYVTEDNGKTVAVFPSDKELRYHIPFKLPEHCMGYMKSVADRMAEPLLVYGDDGEKFGEWPGTYDWVYGEKWLERFLGEIIKNSEWLVTSTFSEALRKRRPGGRVYLPATSYEEMLEWALPADSQEHLKAVIKDMRDSGKEGFYKVFIRGGFWRNFFSKYPESNQMNKRMIYISEKLESLRNSGKINGDGIRLAETDLLRGQCNCAYWHGVFGGLYLFHLRNAVYLHLIRSESAIDSLLYGDKEVCDVDVVDIDADGMDDVILWNRELFLCFDPAEGGVLKEIDAKRLCHNLVNSLARRKESYHGKILDLIDRLEEEDSSGEGGASREDTREADPGIRDNLYYDWYGRYCMIDHFLGKDVDIASFSTCRYDEAGDFVTGAYDFTVEKDAGGVTLEMERNGRVYGEAVSVKKRIILPLGGEEFKIEYTISNLGKKDLSIRFAPEFNLTMPQADSGRYAFILDTKREKYNLREELEADGVRTVEVSDPDRELSWKMEFDRECDLWHFPVRTVSQSEKAYELNYQSSAVVPVFRLDLPAGGERILWISVQLT